MFDFLELDKHLELRLIHLPLNLGHPKLLLLHNVQFLLKLVVDWSLQVSFHPQIVLKDWYFLNLSVHVAKLRGVVNHMRSAQFFLRWLLELIFLFSDPLLFFIQEIGFTSKYLPDSLQILFFLFDHFNAEWIHLKFAEFVKVGEDLVDSLP